MIIQKGKEKLLGINQLICRNCTFKELKNIEYVEKYAREKYYMKKDSEDIYIIEFEGDSAIKTK